MGKRYELTVHKRRKLNGWQEYEELFRCTSNQNIQIIIMIKYNFAPMKL